MQTDLLPKSSVSDCVVSPESYFISSLRKANVKLGQITYNYTKGKTKVQEIVLVPNVVAYNAGPVVHDNVVKSPVKRFKLTRLLF